MSSPTLNSQAEIVQALLIVLGLGSVPPPGSVANNAAWPVYATNEPSEPDNCITVYDTANQTDMRDMFGGKYVRHYGVQIRVRAFDHPTGYQKIKAIGNALAQNVGGTAGPIPVTSGGNPYLVHAIVKIGDTLVLGKDTPKSKRSLFTMNCFLVL